MRGVVAGVVLAASVLLGGSALAAAPPVIGAWHGVLDVGAAKLTLVVRIEETAEGRLEGELESVDQAPGQPFPLSKIVASDGAFSFVVETIGGRFDGAWSAAEGVWRGEWRQSGQSWPLVLKRGAPGPRASIDGLDGTWDGAIRFGAVDNKVSLRVRTDETGSHAWIEAPAFGLFDGAPVTGLEREGDRVRFAALSLAARFEGVLAGETLSGRIHFAARPDAEIRFTRVSSRGEPKERARPQTPEPPFPYRVETVGFANEAAPGVTLAGSLTLPPGDGPHPAAILITGSGPQDRDETLFGHKPFAVLADYLSRRGIAVLRYDDRGTGESTGDFAAATTRDFAGDARAAIAFLKSRPEIDPARIGLIGHSEGALVGALVAADDPEAAFLVMLAGPGVALDELLLTQRRQIGLSVGQDEDQISAEQAVMRPIYQAAARAEDVDAARSAVSARLTPQALKTLGVPPTHKPMLVEELSRDWLRALLSLAPADALQSVSVPVLAVNGALDHQVAADPNLAAIRSALSENGDATVIELEGLNHLFQTARTGAPAEYAEIEETLSPKLLETVERWIAERFGDA